MCTYICKILWEYVCVCVCFSMKSHFHSRENTWAMEKAIVGSKRKHACTHTPIWTHVLIRTHTHTHTHTHIHTYTQTHRHRAKPCSASHTGFTQAPSQSLIPQSVWLFHCHLNNFLLSLCTSLLSLSLQAIKKWSSLATFRLLVPLSIFKRLKGIGMCQNVGFLFLK